MLFLGNVPAIDKVFGTCYSTHIDSKEQQMKIVVKIPAAKPVCRTPIKPKQAHKIATRYQRQSKHRNKEH
jgi:hypothetical protein